MLTCHGKDKTQRASTSQINKKEKLVKKLKTVFCWFYKSRVKYFDKRSKMQTLRRWCFGHQGAEKHQNKLTNTELLEIFMAQNRQRVQFFQDKQRESFRIFVEGRIESRDQWKNHSQDIYLGGGGEKATETWSQFGETKAQTVLLVWDKNYQ